MTSHDHELAPSQPLAVDPDIAEPDPAPEAETLPPPAGPTQSGGSILLHWGLMLAGIAVIALAVWLLG